ncbi:hypothetical protein [Longimicrobium sp.]|uniref:hypothetical protein n=1 Tax=Longimicrobium sp. TaxID=2029185 RepID=UPI002E37E4D7|nr:hypothetical protein [Longimicrobium sp.]HEX6039746.1 hypothetical protein [Longimicrobium sp.]
MRNETRNGAAAALLLDAAASGGMGLLLAGFAGPLAGVLGLPEVLLRYAGAGLLPFAAVLAYLATRREVGRGALWAVIAVNAAWVSESVLLVASGWVSPTSLGTAFVLAQAAAVAVFTWLQFRALPRARHVTAGPA